MKTSSFDSLRKRLGSAFGICALSGSVLFSAGCAQHTGRWPDGLVSGAHDGGTQIEISRTVTVHAQGAEPSELPQGSRWQEIGMTDQGHLFHAVDWHFALEGTEIHESALVVQDDQVVGCWRLSSREFVPVAAPVPLTLKFVQP